MRFYAYRVTDPHGKTYDVGTVHDEETVSVDGLHERNGHCLFFESKACHLERWAWEHGLTLERFVVEIDLGRRSALVVPVVA